MSQKDINYYELLQVSPNADIEVIKAAYKQLARKYHPDSQTQSASLEMMRLINEAHDVLTNDQKRQQYDRLRVHTKPDFSENNQQNHYSAQADTEPSSPPTPARRLIMVSDFHNNTGNWLVTETSQYSMFMQDGFYHIKLNQSGSRSAFPILPLKNFEVSVESQLIVGQSITCGIIFRMQNDPTWGDSFYCFEYGQNGRYALRVVYRGRWIPVLDWQVSSLFKYGSTQMNTIHLKMIDQQIDIHVNGHRLTTVNDTQLGYGHVGLIATAYGSAGEARFRDFRLYQWI